MWHIPPFLIGVLIETLVTKWTFSGTLSWQKDVTLSLWDCGAPTYLVEVFAFLLAQVPLVVREKAVLLLGGFHPKSRGANVV